MFEIEEKNTRDASRKKYLFSVCSRNRGQKILRKQRGNDIFLCTFENEDERGKKYADISLFCVFKNGEKKD